MCNTINGNRDVYFGINGMLEAFDGEYCGHDKNNEKKFIRTYHIVKAYEADDEFLYVTLKQNNDMKKDKVKV